MNVRPSLDQIGVSDLPERAAIIASTSLQRIPPNIIRVGDGFAGDDRRLFSAPSMAWLEAAQVSQATDGRSAAWISTEAPSPPVGSPPPRPTASIFPRKPGSGKLQTNCTAMPPSWPKSACSVSPFFACTTRVNELARTR